MSNAAREQLLELLEEIGAIVGVRGAFIATSDGAITSGERAEISPMVANDVAKTVRRMAVASETVGVPLRELVINFGPARMLVIPLTDDAAVIALLERDTALGPARSLIGVEVNALRDLLRADAAQQVQDPEQERLQAQIRDVLARGLGPFLEALRQEFVAYFTRGGRSETQALAAMQDQVCQWMGSCEPSHATLFLLVDGLGQALADDPAGRQGFFERAQTLVQAAQNR